MPEINPQKIFPRATDIDYVTSVIFQEHHWETPDGILIAIIQNGSGPPASSTPGLILIQSNDRGANWTVLGQINSSIITIASGFMDDNNDLYVTYGVIDDLASALRDIFFLKLTYIPSLRTWSSGSLVTVYNSDATHGGSYPGITQAADGVLWVAFRLFDSTDFEIAVFYSEDNGLTWNDSTQRFGTKNVSPKKAPIPIGLKATGQVGLFYHDLDNSVIDSKRWAVRNDTDAKTAAWVDEEIIQTASIPFGNHQNHAIDENDNVVVVYEDESVAGREIASLIKKVGEPWSDKVNLSFPANVGGMYPGVSKVAGESGGFFGFAGYLEGANQSKLASRMYYLDTGWDLSKLTRHTVSNEREFDSVFIFDSVTATIEDLTIETANAIVGDVKHSSTNGMVEVVGDYIEFGMTERFGYIYFEIDVAGIGGSIDWKYWNGSDWISLSLTDSQDPDFGGYGYVRFEIPDNWTQKTESFRYGYWIRAEVVTSNYTTKPVGSQCTTVKYRRRFAVPTKIYSNIAPVISREGIPWSTFYYIESFLLEAFEETVPESATGQNISRAMVKALLPPGGMWTVAEGEDLDLLLEGVSEDFESVREIVMAAANVRNPYRTLILTDLEKEYGIIGTSGLTVPERRIRLAAAIYNRKNLGTKDDLQAKLQFAGFDVQVHVNSPVIDPADFLFIVYGGICGNEDSVCGNSSSYCGGIGGKVVVNGKLNETYEYVLPTDDSYWPLFFFVGGDAVRNYYGELESIAKAQVPKTREEELRRLIVKYKPMFTWCGLIVEYI